MFIKLSQLFCVVIVAAFHLSSCGSIPASSGVIPILTPQNQTRQPTVTEPEIALDSAANFVREHYGIDTPFGDENWLPGDVHHNKTFITYIYLSKTGEWQASVSYTNETAGEKQYSIRVEERNLGFSWEGLVDGYGNVATFLETLPLPTSTLIAIEPTPTAIPPTPTAIPPTPTAIPPTPTPLPPTPTSVPVPCNAAIFEADITIPDGTRFAPGANFTKTWQLRNIGSCSWNNGYELVFVDGDRMDGRKAVSLPGKIRPGERLNISVELTAPLSPGKYRGYWMFRSDSGEWFGIGKAANKSFWVDIIVIERSSSYQHDFALNYCAATWRSATMRLPCPGYETSREGFTILVDNPNLETRRENELALWVHPNEERYGWIEGVYPSILVEHGDRFRAWVGCHGGQSRCKLNFYLEYINEAGKVNRLGEWQEVYDGMVSDIDIDLSELAGTDIRFILGVEALSKNVDAAHGFWFLPHIQKSN